MANDLAFFPVPQSHFIEKYCEAQRRKHLEASRITIRQSSSIADIYTIRNYGESKNFIYNRQQAETSRRETVEKKAKRGRIKKLIKNRLRPKFRKRSGAKKSTGCGTKYCPCDQPVMSANVTRRKSAAVRKSPRQKSIPKFLNLYKAEDMRFASANGVSVKATSSWPTRFIDYTIDRTVNSLTRIFLLNAMAEIENSTCVRWVPRRKGTRNRVHILNKPDGCWSQVGFVGGKQFLNIEFPKCANRASILHELMHSKSRLKKP